MSHIGVTVKRNRGQDPFLESLITYSCSKCLAHPFRWISWSICLVSSLSHFWGNFKFFSLSYLRYFWLITSRIWLCKDELCSKDDYFFCVVTFLIPAIFVILWWEIGAISSLLVYQSYFHGMPQPKIAQNTNNLSNLFHGQAQAEYYLVQI